MMNWDDEFSNAVHIPDGASYPSIWRRRADGYLQSHANADIDLAYGTHPRQKYDLFRSQSESRGLAIFVHGGFWLEFDKSYWSHLARGLCELGWSVAVPSYVLAPYARISAITAMTALAIEHCADQVHGPIILIGHSAGGHLVTRMVCSNSPLEPNVQDRVRTVVSVSGLHDLRNILKTQMNKQLKLDFDEALAESPALLNPIASANVVCWVGSLERPEFIRQSNLLERAWASRVPSFRFEIESGRHHFDVIESLEDPASSLVRAVVDVPD